MFEDHLAADRGLNCKKRVDWAGEVCSPHTQEKKNLSSKRGGKGETFRCCLSTKVLLATPVG